MQRMTTSNLVRQVTNQYKMLKKYLVEHQPVKKMYLVENESNPVRHLSVGLPQCSGRVKLSLNRIR